MSTKEELPKNSAYVFQRRLSPTLSSNAKLKDLALRHQVFPLEVVTVGRRSILRLATANPMDVEAIKDVEFLTGMYVQEVPAWGGLMEELLQNLNQPSAPEDTQAH